MTTNIEVRKFTSYKSRNIGNIFIRLENDIYYIVELVGRHKQTVLQLDRVSRLFFTFIATTECK